MKNVSSEFKNQLNIGNRNYVRSADITLKNNVVLHLDNSDLWQNGLKIDTATSSSSSFDIGSVIIGKLTLVINNISEEYSDYDFTDCVASNVKVGITLPDGTIESLSYGKFYLNEAKYNGSIITLEFYDVLHKFDRNYSESSLSFPATLGQIVQNACVECGVVLNTVSFDHDDYIIQSRPSDESLTFRQVLQWVCQIACLYCLADELGRLNLLWYDTDTLENIDLSEEIPENPEGYHHLHSFSSINVGLDDVIITGVRVIQDVEGENGTEQITYQSGADGYVLLVSGNKLIQGDSGTTIVSMIAEKLVGIRFRTYSASHLSNPTIEPGDIAVITNRKGRKYKTIITNNTFQPGNFQNTSCGATPPARQSATRYSQITQVYVDYRKEITKERTQREQALEDLNDRVNNSSGLFTTTEEQPDGSKKYYLHNKPSMEESDIIWSMTAEAWSVSTDGGKTQNAGMTVDGDTIVRILTATGVNANWINTGILLVSDEDDNEIMYVDVDTGVVRINAQSLTISGSPVASQQYVRDQVAKLGTLNIILSNDYCSVPADTEGNIVAGGLSGVDTVVTVLYGTTDITDQVQITITESAGIDGSWSAANKKYTVSSVTTDNAWADFSVTYQGINVVKRFTVAKLYPGEDGEPGKNYQLGSSAVTVRRGKYGVLSPAYVDFTSYYFSGDAVRQPYSGRFAIEESVDGMSWTSRYTSEEDEDAVRCHFYSPMVTSAGLYLSDAQGRFLAALELPEDVIAIRCTLYAAGGTTSIIDRQTVSIITDAKSLSAEEYFNLLTDNGRIQGIFMRGNQLFINGEYVQTRGLKAVDENGNTTFYINDKGEVELNVKSLMIAGLGAATQQYAAEQASQALTDSKTYADSVGQNVNNAINQEEIFNRLFANGAVQGISMQKIGSQYYLYINAEYINSGELVGRTIRNENSTLVISYDGSVTSKVLDGGKSGILEDGYLKMQHQDISNLPTSREGVSVENPNFMSHLTAHSIFFFKKSGNTWSTNGGFYADVYDNDFVCYLDAEFLGNVTGVSSYTLRAETDNYATKLKYAAQTASPYISDIGQGITDSSGECYVSIDDIFSETVDQDCEYQVFLQKEGQGDIWVDSKEPAFFIVKGTPNLKFSWELKAKQKGYANERLETYGLSDHENDIDYESFYGSEVEKYFKEQEEMYSEEINQLYVS